MLVFEMPAEVSRSFIVTFPLPHESREVVEWNPGKSTSRWRKGRTPSRELYKRVCLVDTTLCLLYKTSMFAIVFKPFAFLAAGLVIGASLAIVSLASHLPTGWMGAIGLIAWAFVAKQRWTSLEATNGLDPGAPERALWMRLAGTALILGHLATAILLAGNDLRVGQGNTLAIDSWTLVVGQMIAALLFRRDSRQQDERHAAIAARGVRVGYTTFIAVLVPGIAWLAFTPPGARMSLSHFVIANALIALLLVSYAALLFVQLVDYARDTCGAVDDEQTTP
jgi:hypothetical protein